MLLIPAIDLRGGHCVRLLRGDFAAETRYDIEPAVLLERYRELGARWLHVVDLDGARDGQQVNRDIILRLAAMPDDAAAGRRRHPRFGRDRRAAACRCRPRRDRQRRGHEA